MSNFILSPQSTISHIRQSIGFRSEKIVGNKEYDMEDDDIDPDIAEAVLGMNGHEGEIIDTVDGLHDMFILTGDANHIKSDVIGNLKQTLLNDDKLDFEIMELSSASLTREFVDGLRKPNGADGGFLVIDDFTSFAAIPDVNQQIYLLSRIMRNPFGCESTGWRIIFVENTEDRDKWWPKSCVHYYTNKGVLRCLFVE